MSNKTFRLAEHYMPIQLRIFDDVDDIDPLYEEHGECITECLFLSHLAESLESRSCHESLRAIAGELIEFELTKFQPPELIPIYNGPKLFKGEIVYFSYNVLVAKITSYQFPTWQVLLTVVERTTYSILPNFKSQAHIELSAVSL
ncbi:TPA: hypothetical protein AB5B86_003315 [Vibrio cholerae]